jgi:hypothetical protein
VRHEEKVEPEGDEHDRYVRARLVLCLARNTLTQLNH